MPRTVWSGAISFGLVTVPINVQSATEDHSIGLRKCVPRAGILSACWGCPIPRQLCALYLVLGMDDIRP
jgi:hypothetical protein